MSTQASSEGELPVESASRPLESPARAGADRAVDPLFVGCVILLVYFVVLLFRTFRKRSGAAATPSLLVRSRAWRGQAPVGTPRLVEVQVIKQYLEDGQGAVTIKIDDCKPDDTCPICLDTLIGSEDEVRGMPQCGHVYHEKCIVDWLKHTQKARCPLCRRGSELPPAPRPAPPRKHSRGHVF